MKQKIEVFDYAKVITGVLKEGTYRLPKVEKKLTVWLNAARFCGWLR